MTEGQPPNDTYAEQCVLGSMMLSARAIGETTPLLKGSAFYKPAHEQIYAAIVHLTNTGEPVDAVTVGSELEKRGQLRKIGGPAYLLDLIALVPTATNVTYYAKAVASKARLRTLAEYGTRLKQLAYTEASSEEEVDTLLGQGERWFRELHEPDDKAVSFDEMVLDWHDWQSRSDSCIPTPWEALNRYLNGGLQRGRVYVIGARPGVGKSVAALNIADYASHWGFETVMFSLEMSKNEVMSRLLSGGAEVNLSTILSKKLDLDTSQRIDDYIKSNRSKQLKVVDRERITVEQIVSHCRSVSGRIGVVAIDYLQLLTASDPRAPREQQVAHMSRSLKIAARELDVSIVLLSQLNRGSVKDGKPRAPTIADLRESGAVEQDADCVLLLHQDEDDPGFIQVIVGKNRQGKVGKIMLGFEGQYARIV